MAQLLRRLCAMSVLCGAACFLSPEGRSGRALHFACAVVLLASVLTGIRSMDWDSFALETAMIREREQRFLEESGSMTAELDRRVIEGRCEAYILDKAGEMEIPLQAVRIGAQWHTEGVWVPWTIHFYGSCSEEEQSRLQQTATFDLGIPADRQEWN